MKKILFYYCFVVALFISLSGILTSQNTTALLFQLLFIPITIYFTYSVLTQIFYKKTKLIEPASLNRGAFIFTIVLFLILIVSSIVRVVKKPHQEAKQTVQMSITPSPKLIITPYLKVKNEYQKDVINIRQEPSSKSKIIGILNTKKNYQIVSKKNQWYEILYDKGLNGFVNEMFVTNL